MTPKQWAIVIGLATIALVIKAAYKAWNWLQNSFYFCRRVLFKIESRRQ